MSIKICVITPISHLGDYGSLGEMDMSLTHMILPSDNEDSYAAIQREEYIRYYKQQKKKGRFVILDNSAFEMEQQGKGFDPDPVLDAAEIINPSEVIATDVLFDGPATVESTKRFVEAYKGRYGILRPYQIMAVPQGSSIKEWWDCFLQLMAMEDIDTIGLSKLSIPMSWLGEKESEGNCARARLACTEKIENYLQDEGGYDEDTGKYAHHKQFHLLGGDNWTPWEMEQQKKLPWIRSNDSSCAVWYGAHDKIFNEEGKIDQIIMEKPDLENEHHHTVEMLENGLPGPMGKPRYGFGRANILENIIRWHMACK